MKFLINNKPSLSQRLIGNNIVNLYIGWNSPSEEIMVVDLKTMNLIFHGYLDIDVTELDFDPYDKPTPRKVGEESSKTYSEKLAAGFFDKWMSGKGLDIGYRGYLKDTVPILDTATGIEKEQLNPDGTLPFLSETQDYVYNSHVLEHIENYKQAIQEWYRVLKIGGHLVITVPHRDLYEKKLSKPSWYNGDHRRYYTPASLLREIEESLEPNSYRMKLLEDGDVGYDYSIPPQKHCTGQCEIVLVLQKIKVPTWKIQ